jgi:long-chain fatty acid transport protein
MRIRHGAVTALFALALGLLAQSSRGAGFHVNEQDARATGRADAVLASPSGASTIQYNPAGIATLRGLHINLGASLIAPSAEFEPAGDGPKTEAESNTFVLPHLYVSGRLTDVLALGLGINAPFGLALTWPSTSPGRAQVREAELRTLFVTPTLALDLSQWAPGLSVGAGVELVPASVRLIRDVPFGDEVGSAALSGSAFGAGVRAGVLYRPPNRPDWAFGISYKSPVALDFDGNADFDAPPIYRSSLPPDGKGATHITLPQSLMLGVAFQPLPAWELEVDGGWVGWSSYGRLDIELPNGDVTRSERNWRDTLVLRVGTDYTFEERWTGRFGFIFDQTPIPTTTLDFQLPDAPRFDLTAGFGAQLSPEVQVDIGALWVLPTARDTSNVDPLQPPVKGRFEVEAWVVTISLGMRFGAGERSLLVESFPTTPAPLPPRPAPPISPLFEPGLPPVAPAPVAPAPAPVAPPAPVIPALAPPADAPAPPSPPEPAPPPPPPSP